MIFAVNNPKSKQSQGQQKDRKGKKLRTQPKGLCVQGNSKRPISVYIATTVDCNEASSDAHTEEYIPLGIATPTPTSTSAFPTQCSQPSLQPPNVNIQIDVEASPLDSQQGTHRDCDMGDTPAMTRGQERVVALAQEVHEEEPSNATPEPTAEAKHDTTRPKIKDAKKASNEIITDSRVLAGVMTELEMLVPEAHTSLKRVKTIAVKTTTNALFVETTLPGKSKSATPILLPDSYESEEHQEKSVAPAIGSVIRELDVEVPMRDVQEASYAGKGKAIWRKGREDQE
ncbi:hypothetical protein Cgig2_021602 [Carnegiea gigantea]|uniref:Uncharacterized protein n=1 Tax=Carnegiea gigantea TaxID=171969 RepID=A0A9Q1GJZ1_9CARY|nr:hypothetical protein Cgig2_021602 [Carnegiea gigantea]